MNALKNRTARAAAYALAAAGLLALSYVAFTPKPVAAQDATYGPKVYKDNGGDRENVASGGSIVVYAGGTLDASAGTALLPTLPSLSVTGPTVAIGSVQVSTSASSSAKMVFAGAFQTLPTSGWSEGTLAYQLSDHTLYIATQTVVIAQSWKAAY